MDEKVAVAERGIDEDLHREFFEYVQRVKGIDEQSYYKLSKQEMFDLNKGYNVDVTKAAPPSPTEQLQNVVAVPFYA
jgi:hypothetical protein